MSWGWFTVRDIVCVVWFRYFVFPEREFFPLLDFLCLTFSLIFMSDTQYCLHTYWPPLAFPKDSVFRVCLSSVGPVFLLRKVFFCVSFSYTSIPIPSLYSTRCQPFVVRQTVLCVFATHTSRLPRYYPTKVFKISYCVFSWFSVRGTTMSPNLK